MCVCAHFVHSILDALSGALSTSSTNCLKFHRRSFVRFHTCSAHKIYVPLEWAHIPIDTDGGQCLSCAPVAALSAIFNAPARLGRKMFTVKFEQNIVRWMCAEAVSIEPENIQIDCENGIALIRAITTSNRCRRLSRRTITN